MNKFQKIASQCSKDDMRKGVFIIPYKTLKNNYLKMFRERNANIEYALGFKKWNKGCEL